MPLFSSSISLFWKLFWFCLLVFVFGGYFGFFLSDRPLALSFLLSKFVPLFDQQSIQFIPSLTLFCFVSCICYIISLSFYLEMISNSQKSCKNNTEHELLYTGTQLLTFAIFVDAPLFSVIYVIRIISPP